jgi:N-acetyl sugar amidotransferase
MTFEMKYCTRCVYPATKPRLVFNDEGICSACTAFEQRASIDWAQRMLAFDALCRNIQAKNSGPYDCVIPVSGGKDSTYQLVTALKYGLRPLAVTAMTCDLTSTGWRNLQNISKLGVDHIMVQTDQKLRKRLNKFCLETVGDISWPEHVTIFTVPIREAVMRGIPLILYGECPENEYGGPLGAQGTHRMSMEWIDEFGGLCGLRPGDIVEQGIATEAQMEQYKQPCGRIEGWGGEALFLGYYFPWDGQANVEFAEEHGFENWGAPRHGQMPGENLDNYQTGIHDRFKFLKFGFGRVTDHCCNAIRRGRMSRAEAVEKANAWDGTFPSAYMGAALERTLKRIGMTFEEYIRCEQKFANTALFRIGSDGLLKRQFTVK